MTSSCGESPLATTAPGRAVPAARPGRVEPDRPRRCRASATTWAPSALDRRGGASGRRRSRHRGRSHRHPHRHARPRGQRQRLSHLDGHRDSPELIVRDPGERHPRVRPFLQRGQPGFGYPHPLASGGQGHLGRPGSLRGERATGRSALRLHSCPPPPASRPSRPPWEPRPQPARPSCRPRRRLAWSPSLSTSHSSPRWRSAISHHHLAQQRHDPG